MEGFSISWANLALRWGLFVGVIALCTPATAAALEPGWLDWTAPPECPTSQEIDSKVRDWVKESMPGRERIRIEAQAVSDGNAWVVHIFIHDGTRRTERHVATRTCEDAGELVAIAASLALVPGTAVPGRRGTVTQHTPPTAEPSSRLGEARERTDDGETLPGSVEPVGGRDASAAGSRPLARQDSSGARRIEGRDRSGQLGWMAHATALFASGLLPDVRAGLGLGAGLRSGRSFVGLGVLWFPAVSAALPSGGSRIELGSLGAEASFAYLWGPGRLEWGPSWGVSAGAVLADQAGDGGARAATTVPWLATAIGARARLTLFGTWAGTFGVDLAIPLVRPDLILSDGSPVYRSDVGVRGLLQLSFGSRAQQ